MPIFKAKHCLQLYKLYSRENINKLEGMQSSGSEAQNWALAELVEYVKKHRFLGSTPGYFQVIPMYILGQGPLI